MPAPIIGAPCGGVRSCHVAPPSIERIRFTAWPPPASVTPTQIVCVFDGSIATREYLVVVRIDAGQRVMRPVTPSSVAAPDSVLRRSLNRAVRRELDVVHADVGEDRTPAPMSRRRRSNGTSCRPSCRRARRRRARRRRCVGDAATSATSPPGGPSRLQLPVPTPAGAGALAEAKRVARACAPRSSLFTLSPSRMSACGVIALERGWRRGGGGARERGAEGSDNKRQATLLHQNDPLSDAGRDSRVGAMIQAFGGRPRPQTRSCAFGVGKSSYSRYRAI